MGPEPQAPTTFELMSLRQDASPRTLTIVVILSQRVGTTTVSTLMMVMRTVIIRNIFFLSFMGAIIQTNVIVMIIIGVITSTCIPA